MPSDSHWVGTWAAAPAPAEGVVGFNNHTLRLNPRISLGGDRLRVRISNAYGNRPLAIGAAHIALRDKGPAIVADSGRTLSFGGGSRNCVQNAILRAHGGVISGGLQLEKVGRALSGRQTGNRVANGPSISAGQDPFQECPALRVANRAQYTPSTGCFLTSSVHGLVNDRPVLGLLCNTKGRGGTDHS